MTNGKDFAEKMFSKKNEVVEKHFSTGSEELDAMLEKAFCDGYEYAQKEFAEKKDEKKNHTGAKVAAGVAGTAALAGATVYGAKKVGEAMERKGFEKRTSLKNLGNQYRDVNTGRIVGKNEVARRLRETEETAGERIGKSLQKPADFVSEKLGKGKKAVTETAKKGKKAVEGAYENTKKAVTETAKKGKKSAEEMVTKTGKKVTETWKNMPKGGKAAVIAAPVVAAGVGTGMAIKRKKAKKNNK